MTRLVFILFVFFCFFFLLYNNAASIEFCIISCPQNTRVPGKNKCTFKICTTKILTIQYLSPNGTHRSGCPYWPLDFHHLLMAQDPMSVPPAHQFQQHHSWAALLFPRAEPHPGLALAHPHPQGGAWCHPGAWNPLPGWVVGQAPAAQLCPDSLMGAPAPLTLTGPWYSAWQTGNARGLALLHLRNVAVHFKN